MKRIIFSLFIFISFGFIFEAEAGILKSKQRKSMRPEHIQALLNRIDDSAVTNSNSKKEWQPGREIRSICEEGRWYTFSDKTYDYEENTGFISVVTEDDRRDKYTYNPDGTKASATAEYLYGTEWIEENSRTYKYDEFIPGLRIELMMYEDINGNGKMILTYIERKNITRNKDGNITRIEYQYYLYDPGYTEWYDGQYRHTISYGSDGKAIKITNYYFDFDLERWKKESVLSDIIWDRTDGQIIDTYFSEEEFYLNKKNRIKSASLEIPGELNAKIEASYPAEDSFNVAISINDETVEQWVYVTDDQYGSSTSTITHYEENPLTGKIQTYQTVETKTVDAFGRNVNSTIYEEVDNIIDYYFTKKADVTYDATYGYPLEYLYSSSYDGETFENNSRIVLSDYVEVTSGIGSVETDATSPAVYYNLQGMKIENPTPGNLYIRRHGDKVSKIIY